MTVLLVLTAVTAVGGQRGRLPTCLAGFGRCTEVLKKAKWQQSVDMTGNVPPPSSSTIYNKSSNSSSNHTNRPSRGTLCHACAMFLLP